MDGKLADCASLPLVLVFLPGLRAQVGSSGVGRLEGRDTEFNEEIARGGIVTAARFIITSEQAGQARGFSTARRSRSRS